MQCLRAGVVGAVGLAGGLGGGRLRGMIRAWKHLLAGLPEALQRLRLASRRGEVIGDAGLKYCSTPQ